jgi:DNA polymerase-3 subunit delta'
MARRSAAAEHTEEEIPAHHPKMRENLIGHDACEKELLGMIHAGRLPHALLLTGLRGIGKATLAYRLARFLLSPQEEEGASLFGEALPVESLHVAAEHPIFRRVAIGSHPDLLVLEAEDIKIEQARHVGEFLSLTPGESKWRVVIIDSIDAMNRNAANALLKTLEEPPGHTMLILVSHNPGMLLPTIRSRCRTLRLAPLNSGGFARVLGQMKPELGMEDTQTWSLLSGGAPGVAIALMEAKADVMYKDLLEMMANPNVLKSHSFADKFARKDADTQFRVLSRLMLWLPARIVVPVGAEVFPGERALLERLAREKPIEAWTAWWEMAGRLLSDTQHLHLDRKQAILTLLGAVAS